MDNEPPKSDSDSLETPSTTSVTKPTQQSSAASVSSGGGNNVAPVPDAMPAKLLPARKLSANRLVRLILAHVNIYLVLFVIFIGSGVGIAIVAYNKSTHSTNANNNAAQNLSPQALQQLANNGTTIGDAQQTLNIQSNSVFDGTVLVRGSLQVAGTVKMGGSLALSGLSVSGASTVGQLQAKGVSVAGNETIQGQFSAASLSVAGSGNFNGAVTAPTIATNSLQLNGNLQLTHHINTGGGVPVSSRGSALGGGGTASVSGSDTAGSISIHTGGDPGSGCFATINFVNAFGNTPHVIVTPIGLAAADLNYYVNRSSTNFSVCTTNPAPAGTSFGFDYVVIG